MARTKKTQKTKTSQSQLRRFKSSPLPLIVALPLIPVVLLAVSLIVHNATEMGLGGFLRAMLSTALSPVGLVLLLLTAGYFVHQSQLRKERLWRRKRLPLFARLRFRKERAPQTCAFCHDALQTDQVACPGCEVAMHASCRAEALGCGTLGCEHEGRAKVRLFKPSYTLSKPGH